LGNNHFIKNNYVESHKVDKKNLEAITSLKVSIRNKTFDKVTSHMDFRTITLSKTTDGIF
jgi:hypothetical protein